MDLLDMHGTMASQIVGKRNMTAKAPTIAYANAAGVVEENANHRPTENTRMQLAAFTPMIPTMVNFAMPSRIPLQLRTASAKSKMARSTPLTGNINPPCITACNTGFRSSVVDTEWTNMTNQRAAAIVLTVGAVIYTGPSMH
mmetsp:Transcript_21057/g.31476  ORF Transcript_21057/g.31476 Transcript_21057/m.31476 type:complete len:142 (-) Transcript_21057:167-592(-)